MARRLTFMARLRSIKLDRDMIESPAIGSVKDMTIAPMTLRFEIETSGSLLEGDLELLQQAHETKLYKMPVITIDWESPWHETVALRSALEAQRNLTQILNRELQQLRCKHEFDGRVEEDETSSGDMVGYLVKTCKLCGKVESE